MYQDKMIDLYTSMGIVPYGSHVDARPTDASLKRMYLFLRYGMRCIMSPDRWRESPLPRKLSLAMLGFAIDNGAYCAHMANEPFQEDKFTELVDAWGDVADWIVIPDVIYDAGATIAQANQWINRLSALNDRHRYMFVWQDGMTREDITPILKDGIGIFVGGSTEGKLENMMWISDLCYEYNTWCHIGRVNSQKRIQLCMDANADSFDGSGYSRFLNAFNGLEFLVRDRQLNLFNGPSKYIMNDWIVDIQIRQSILDISDDVINEYIHEMNSRDLSNIGMRKSRSPSPNCILRRKNEQVDFI